MFVLTGRFVSFYKFLVVKNKIENTNNKIFSKIVTNTGIDEKEMTDYLFLNEVKTGLVMFHRQLII